MPSKPVSKYDLKDLHQEIDFFDRKIAYCQNYEQFESEEERAAALRKLTTKRESLVKSALDAINRGIEFDPKYLPRSLKESVAAAKASA